MSKLDIKLFPSILSEMYVYVYIYVETYIYSHINTHIYVRTDVLFVCFQFIFSSLVSVWLGSSGCYLTVNLALTRIHHCPNWNLLSSLYSPNGWWSTLGKKARELLTCLWLVCVLVSKLSILRSKKRKKKKGTVILPRVRQEKREPLHTNYCCFLTETQEITDVLYCQLCPN